MNVSGGAYKMKDRISLMEMRFRFLTYVAAVYGQYLLFGDVEYGELYIGAAVTAVCVPIVVLDLFVVGHRQSEAVDAAIIVFGVASSTMALKASKTCEQALGVCHIVYVVYHRIACFYGNIAVVVVAAAHTHDSCQYDCGCCCCDKDFKKTFHFFPFCPPADVFFAADGCII